LVNNELQVALNFTPDANVPLGNSTYRAVFDAAFQDATLKPNRTYIFELMHPENSTICPYDHAPSQETLVHLATRSTEPPYEFYDDDIGFSRPKVSFRSYREAQEASQQASWHLEGYVLVMDDGRRVKIRNPSFVMVQAHCRVKWSFPI